MVAVVLHALASVGMVISPSFGTPEPVVMARAQSPTMIFGRKGMQLNKPRKPSISPELAAAIGLPPPPPPSNPFDWFGRGDGGDGDDLTFNLFAVVLAAAAGAVCSASIIQTELLYILRSLKVNFGFTEATLGAARRKVVRSPDLAKETPRKGWMMLAETELLSILRSLKVNFGFTEATLGDARRRSSKGGAIA